MTTEGCSTVASHSLGSLVNPNRGGKSKQNCSSQPFIKPQLKLSDQIRAKILKHLHFKILNPQETNIPVFQKEAQWHLQQTDFSIDDSRCILKDLAAELDRIVQLKDTTIVSRVSNAYINEEESSTLILEWADELRSLQQTSKGESMKQIAEELKAATDQQASDMQQRLKDGKRIISDWIRKSSRVSQNFAKPHFTAEHKAVITDLCKQWKKGQQTNMLPVMDFIIRCIPQKNKPESILQLWFKTEQKFAKTGHMRIPALVWNWITKPSAKVTLDPNTANPTLMLSQDERSVRTKTHKETNSSLLFQRKCNQYDCWPCVQAKQGYLTGRHYWEVDVKKKYDWRIGVVKESAPRNGFVHMNTTRGYWTLRLQLGSLIAMTDPITKLNQFNPSKIGVYLDIEEDHLSFYDTEKMKHIYTFKTDFSKSGKIYPVFGTVETDRPLKIM
ncbi:E3 ubiquitin-protein ligase TRIM7-like isoform X3 [Electrophorus electricus]|uniref:E3 ubiquitin-protein ligase TRIM7-like isoform X3 n=1 Tax=Electrophorus electricus TaxID=8005 RepID=UPI0015D0C929|nr:E3 ubiquitin-protein ligase TRIM7-like isoform X3 [Electrophorus electricus]